MSALGQEDFDELLSTTVQKLESELVDQVMEAHPTLDALKQVAKKGDGPSVIQPIRLGLVNRTAVSDELGTFSTSVDGPIAGVAKYEYSNPIITPTSVAFRTLALNAGPNRVIDLVKAHLGAAKDDHASTLAAYLHADAADVADASVPFNSLDALVGNAASDAAAVQVGVYKLGGVDSSAVAAWQATRETITDATDIRLAFRQVANSVLDRSGKKADIILAGADVFDEYEASLDDQIRYNALSVGDTRFRELRFDGVVVRRDGNDCPDDRAYFLYTPAVIVEYLAGYFMKVEKTQRVQGTLTDVIPMATMLAVGTTERRAHGLLIRTQPGSGS
jgi:hypothetical protein